MAMEYRHLGRTGLRVSVLSFGAWVTFGTQVKLEAAKSLLRKCLSYGVNFFDNAEVYGQGKAEEIMGEAIVQLIQEGTIKKRSDLIISTKIFWGGQGVNERGLSRKHILEGTQASLKRLQLDYVDLIFCHRPDPTTPIEETVRAMNYVINKGWAFYWGTSEWSAEQIKEAWEISERLGLIGPAMEQPEYNMLNRDKIEREFLPLFEEYGLGTTTWSPLASGVLTGKYTKDNVPEGTRLALEEYKGLRSRKLVEQTLSMVDALKPIAADLRCTLAQLAIAWCAKNPHVSTVITGASKESQVEENMRSLELLPKLTRHVLERIEEIINKPE